ncbi:MAG: hypothetical protein KKG92_12095, partial [Gammaproteobacteria bacterium]|nr:hypothetical protein [Gammaproteobacteria bacterium]
MKQFSLFSGQASVARMEHRGIRDLWLTIVRRFRGISPDSADEAPKRRTKPPKDGGQVPAYALHPGYAGWIPAFAGMTAFF